MSVTSLWGRLATEDKIADLEQSLSENKGVTLTTFGRLDFLKMKENYLASFLNYIQNKHYTLEIRIFCLKNCLRKCNIINSKLSMILKTIQPSLKTPEITRFLKFKETF